IGAGGRMGTRIDALASADAGIEVVARLHRENAMQAGLAHRAKVLVDFSTEAGTRAAIDVARASGAALLVGTTGLSDALRADLKALSTSNAVLLAPNTSLGVAITRRLARMAAEMLGPAEWSVDIVESHHDRKKDAPSGTALAIAASLGEGGMRVPPDRIHAIRAGDTIGEHEIRFAGPAERMLIMHQAVSRDLFAAGALRAAKWLAGRAPGWYTMDDVLGTI
ncbi:MAG: 4-hydroxy-tetrahydrodipicolinate reductase, partial [bacterium]